MTYLSKDRSDASVGQGFLVAFEMNVENILHQLHIVSIGVTSLMKLRVITDMDGMLGGIGMCM